MTDMRGSMPPFKAENRDIKRYLAWQYVKRILLTAAMYLAVIACVVWYSLAGTSVSASGAVVGAVILIVFAIVPYFLIWHKFLSERSVCGRLVRKKFCNERELGKGILTHGEMMQYLNGNNASFERHIVYFVIETDGREVEKRFYDDGMMAPLFFDGDTVCFRRGLKAPYNLSAVRQSQYICVVCGRVVPDIDTVCPVCGHSIITLDGHIPTYHDDCDDE